MTQQAKPAPGPARIGIFGGSFNPIHAGHVGLALRAAKELSLDKILVVPASLSPFKVPGAAPPPGGRTFSGAERWELVVQACAPHSPLLEPCDIELRRGGVSYAIDTVRTVRAAHPNAALFFLVGEDAAFGLDKWKDYEELKKLCTFAVFPRTCESSTEIRRRLAAGEPADEMLPPGLRSGLCTTGAISDP